jgi:hypothetical protein
MYMNEGTDRRGTAILVKDGISSESHQVEEWQQY